MSDYENPGRRYKWFRPGQSARAFAQQNSPTNRGTVALFNNSAGIYFLLVRTLRVSCGGAEQVNVAYLNTQFTGTAGTIQALVPSAATPPGAIVRLDTTTHIVPDFAIIAPTNGDAVTPNDFPIAVIEPGWSFVLQDNDNATSLTVAMIYEYVFPDQLDWFY